MEMEKKKTKQMKKGVKRGDAVSCLQVPVIWTINITTLKVIFKLYGDLLRPNFLCQIFSGRIEVLEVERLPYLVWMIQN